MQVNFNVSTCEEYFAQTGREIDWDDDYQTQQADELQQILASEISIFFLRRATGICGSVIDSMIEVRRDLINKYESSYDEKYVEYNDFY